MNLTDISRFISLILRHKPESIGITLDEHGWANVDELIEGISRTQYFDSIYFYHKGLVKYVGVMLIGAMEVLTDQETKNDIWRTGDKLFYKQGVTDPDYCVLKFTASKGRYYCDLKTENFDV